MNLPDIKIDISESRRHRPFIEKVLSFLASDTDFVILRNKGNKSIFLRRKYFITIDGGAINLIEIKDKQQFENLISISMLSIVDVVPVNSWLTAGEQVAVLEYASNYSTSPTPIRCSPTNLLR